MKKFFAILLALTMVLSLGAVAFAAPADVQLSVKEGDKHTYAVYQIFVGDLATDKKTLSNVVWGANGTGTAGAKVDAATLAAVAGITGTDLTKATALKAYVDLNSDPIGTVSAGNPMSVPTGYYLLKDLGVKNADGSYTVPANDELSIYIVNIVGPTEIVAKKGETITEKKVDDKNDSNNSEDEIVWNDSADHDIHDAVPFKLYAKITDKYDNYKNYYFAFHDKQSAGLTFKPETVEVFVDGNKITSGYEVVSTGLTDGCTFEVRFADLKTISAVHAGSEIVVTYKSELNENAVIGAAGNPNTMYGEYSNNPNGEGTGKTPDDTVIVFTYKVVVNKVDQDKQPLKGATFELFKKVNGEWVSQGTCVAAANGDSFTASWEGLDDGDYKLVETVTPDGYNTMAAVEFTVTASHEIEWDGEGPAFVSLSGDGLTGEVITSTTGTLSSDIVNQKGSELPETGGIGTTIFYIVGGVLVLAAAVLFVTKKRMGTAE